MTYVWKKVKTVGFDISDLHKTYAYSFYAEFKIKKYLACEKSPYRLLIPRHTGRKGNILQSQLFVLSAGVSGRGTPLGVPTCLTFYLLPLLTSPHRPPPTGQGKYCAENVWQRARAVTAGCATWTGLRRHGTYQLGICRKMHIPKVLLGFKLDFYLKTLIHVLYEHN